MMKWSALGIMRVGLITAGQHRTLQDTADVDAVLWLTSYGS